jgi:Thioredoxin
LSNLVVAIALAGGTWIFVAFLVAVFFAFVFSYYTRSGSGISQRPYRRPDAPAESPSELAHDTTQELRNWSRGTEGQHREHQGADAPLLPDPIAEALAAWRRASGTARTLDPPVGESDRTRGPADRPTVAVYLDVSSDASRNAYRILSGFVDAQQIRLAVRHLPLADVHPLSLPAAEALEAAASQGRFFEVLDRLAALEVTDESQLIEVACDAVPDPHRLREDVGSGRHQAAVVEQIRHAKASGVHSVPELFIDGAHYDRPIWRDELERTLRR